MLSLIELPEAMLNRAKLMVKELLRNRGELTQEEVISILAPRCAQACIEEAVSHFVLEGSLRNRTSPAPEEGTIK